MFYYFCFLLEGLLIFAMQLHQAQMPFVIKVHMGMVWQYQIRVLSHRCYLLLQRIPHYKDLLVWFLAVTCHRHLVHLMLLSGSQLLYCLSLFLFINLNAPLLYFINSFRFLNRVLLCLFRDGRYSIPRTSSLSVDEQQRMQQYNQMLAGRNIHQSSMSGPTAISGADRGVRMLPGGNAMGTMCGMNRGMPSRPGFQGMASSSMLNPGTMLSSSVVGMPSPVNMHSGAASGQVNSMLRPREALHMVRVSFNYYMFLWLFFFLVLVFVGLCVCANVQRRPI